MVVFISWSGDRSRKVAELLVDLLQNVIQTSKPWMSQHSIEAGEDWFRAIERGAGSTVFGILCLTPENQENPWILYEAGLLRKGFESSRVSALLLGLSTKDVRSPLREINNVPFSKEGVLKLFQTFNANTENKLVPERISAVFEMAWSAFETKVKEILSTPLEDEIKNDVNQPSFNLEILARLRSIENRILSQAPKQLGVLPDVMYGPPIDRIVTVFKNPDYVQEIAFSKVIDLIKAYRPTIEITETKANEELEFITSSAVDMIHIGRMLESLGWKTKGRTKE